MLGLMLKVEVKFQRCSHVQMFPLRTRCPDLKSKAIS